MAKPVPFTRRRKPKRQTKKNASKELQEKLISVIESSGNLTKTATMFDMCHATVQRIYSKYRKYGKVVIKKKGGIIMESKIKREDKDYLEKLITEDYKITLRDIQHQLMINRNINLSLRTVGIHLKKMNYTYKRIYTGNKNILSANLEDRRMECSHRYIQLLDEEKVKIFYHDCQYQGDILRKYYGWVKKGNHIPKLAPDMKSRNIGIMSFIVKNEIIFYIQDSPVYFIYLISHLEDLLDYIGDEMSNITFIMYNLPFNKYGEVRQFIEERGHELLYLPPKNVFFKYVDKTFSKWKSIAHIKSTDDIEKIKIAIEYFSFLFTKENFHNYYEKAKDNFLKFINVTPVRKL